MGLAALAVAARPPARASRLPKFNELPQGALAACTAVWAMEAAFLLLVCLGQRLRLLLMRFFTRAAPATKEWAMSLPRNTEEATAQFNYQLNLIGLQTEQWMTDTWAGYLRQRRKWMSGSSKGGGSSGARAAAAGQATLLL